MKVRHHKFRWALIGLWCALLSSTLVFAASLQAQASPTIAIVSPAEGATVDGPVTLRITHSGIRFDGIRIGYDPEPGAGHWHVNIDGKYAGLAVTNVVEIPNDAFPVIPAGRHTIMVDLHQNNHTPLNPPVSQSINLNFAKEVRLVNPSAAQPSIKLVNPSQSTVSIDAPLVVRIEHSGIRFDGLRSGKNPEPGTGHWHVNIDGRYAGLSVSNVLEIPNDSYPVIAPGQHSATVYLHQNNHAAVDPPVSISFTINASTEVRIGTGAAAATATTAAATTAPTTAAAATATTAPTTAGRTATATSAGRTATPAGRTATPAVTATTAATRAATATTAPTVAGGTTATAVAGGGPPIVQIPSTGQSGANLTPTFLAAIISIVLGSMLMYLSHVTRVPATAGGSSLAGSIGGDRRINWPWSGAGQLGGRAVLRKLTSLSSILGFVAGAFFGIGIGSLALGMTSGPATNVANVVSDVAVAPAAPIVAPTAAIVAPVAVAPAAPAPAPQQPMLPIDGSLAWPAYVPTGMMFAPEESWPFQVVDAQQLRAPFLVFRDDTRWLVLRHQAEAAAVLPHSAQAQTTRVGEAPASFVGYADGGFTLTWQQDGTPIQLSGVGLSVDDATAVAASLEPQSSSDLQARLAMEAVHQQMNITALWPSTLPAGFKLETGASLAQFSQPGVDLGADAYDVTFRNGDAMLRIGGGNVSAPTMGGQTEHINAFNRSATITTSKDRILLTIDADASGGSAVPAFPIGISSRLPLVQTGRVFVLAENLDRATFDRFVAGLLPLRPQEFSARASGQTTNEIPYLWPGSLPQGYSFDLSKVRSSWSDYVLQGGRPFYELTATTAAGASLTIQGGGDAYLVPEGPEVEQVTARVHGQGATAVRTPDESVVFWTEQGTFFTVRSSSMKIDELIAFANSLKAISASSFANHVR